MAEFDQLLTTARAAYTRGDWQAAHGQLSRARTLGDLTPEDLSLFGSSAWWIGRIKESLEISEEVSYRLQDDGDPSGAAMKALNVGLVWFTRGDLVIASGWVNRARRILSELPLGQEHGYLQYLDAALAIDFTDLQPTREAAAELKELGRRLHAPVLTSFGLVLSGLADLRIGQTAAGFAQLDEAMLPVLAGQLPPEWAGDIYCLVIHACHDLADVDRMRAWTQATEQWCEQFSGEVVYSGICRVHRLQLACIEGGWDTAAENIEQSATDLVGCNNWVAGEAFYELGELRRLRGDTRGAQDAFDHARQLGTDPQPGQALLQHHRGRTDEAWTSLCASLAGRDQLSSARLLHSAVDVALALGLADEADRMCRHLEETADVFSTAGFRAWAGRARAAVLIAQSRYADALPFLQAAVQECRGMHARYDTAKIYELFAKAHRGLGEDGAAASDTATALAIYRELGAAPDIHRLDVGRVPGGLTEREAEVLAYVAAGASNKHTAEALFISQKTVGRHLANIFAKLGVSSRTAAAAWAHEHGLLQHR